MRLRFSEMEHTHGRTDIQRRCPFSSFISCKLYKSHKGLKTREPNLNIESTISSIINRHVTWLRTENLVYEPYEDNICITVGQTERYVCRLLYVAGLSVIGCLWCCGPFRFVALWQFADHVQRTALRAELQQHATDLRVSLHIWSLTILVRVKKGIRIFGWVHPEGGGST
jgi:hypothetical protein